MSLPPFGEISGIHKYVNQLDMEIEKLKTDVANMIAEMNRLQARGDEAGARREATTVYITKHYMENLCVSRKKFMDAFFVVNEAESTRVLGYALDKMSLG